MPRISIDERTTFSGSSTATARSAHSARRTDAGSRLRDQRPDDQAHTVGARRSGADHEGSGTRPSTHREGRRELEQGHVSGRLEQIRARIAQLTSRVTYDPTEDAGVLIASGAFLAEDDVADALSLLARLDARSFGPIPASFEESAENEPGDYRLLVPRVSHSTVCYSPTESTRRLRTPPSSSTSPGGRDGRLERPRRSNRSPRRRPEREGSSIDVITLLIEANRSDVESVLESSETGFLLGDDREFPINRFEEARDLAESTRGELGGVVDFNGHASEPSFRIATRDGRSARSRTPGRGAVVVVAVRVRSYDLLGDAVRDGLPAQTRASTVDHSRPRAERQHKS